MNLVKLPTGKPNLQLRVSKGHYATSHSHINYYIDVTLTKFRLSEARAAAAELVRAYKSTTIVDTILCLDGTEVIGACMASELTKAGYTNMNAHQTIYVVTPEHTTGSQLLFRENTAPMIAGKHVLVLAASVTTGYTVQARSRQFATTAVTRPASRQFLPRSRSARAIRWQASLTPMTCPTMRPMTPTTAPGAGRARKLMPLSTASATPACKFVTILPLEGGGFLLLFIG